MWLRWLPWKFIIRRLARAQGFLDPIALLARLHRFAQPAEVAEPIELLRAGVVFHARGLINSRVIQHNLDWVWPYWIERQWSPLDDAFVPRAFTITHINLTLRNWTALGLPSSTELPIVDPRGLLTPFHDSWSLDGWLVTPTNVALLPSRCSTTKQHLEVADQLGIHTTTLRDDLALHLHATVLPYSAIPLPDQTAMIKEFRRPEGGQVVRLRLTATAPYPSWAIVALRPYNPEGISFIHSLRLSSARTAWLVNGEHSVYFNTPVDHHHISTYMEGDVYAHLREKKEQITATCEIGLLTAAAMFDLSPKQPREIVLSIPLPESKVHSPPVFQPSWREALHSQPQLSIPNNHFQFLYDAALRTVVLHSAEEIYPGPYTYKRFWFRDAAFIINALLMTGLQERAEHALDQFPAKQAASGYFRSQDGEWDSNGQVLWIMQRYCQVTGLEPKPEWRTSIIKGGHWITNKRLADSSDRPEAGLLPAGFSAEHLGPNDNYYWDDFWGVAGLQAASWLTKAFGDHRLSQHFSHQAHLFSAALDRSIEKSAHRLGCLAIPASPHRRLDSGAIGSLAIGYPLQLCAADDPRLRDTLEFLLANCLVKDGFFQDMVHSGINPYLTLHLAQVLLRANDPRFLALMTTVADLASPTGQWPEAIHPRTLGGCMGDGQHVWAAAEWLLMIRNCFLREEGDRLIIGAGIPRPWLQAKSLRLGPAPTLFGPISLTIRPLPEQKPPAIELSWQASWHRPPTTIELRLSGCPVVSADPNQNLIVVQPLLALDEEKTRAGQPS